MQTCFTCGQRMQSSLHAARAALPRGVSFGLYVYHAFALYLVEVATSKLACHPVTLKTSPIAFALKVSIAAVSFAAQIGGE